MARTAVERTKSSYHKYQGEKKELLGRRLRSKGGFKHFLTDPLGNFKDWYTRPERHSWGGTPSSGSDSSGEGKLRTSLGDPHIGRELMGLCQIPDPRLCLGGIPLRDIGHSEEMVLRKR